MNIAIVYASYHGATGIIAGKIKDGLTEHQVDVYNLAKDKKIDLAKYGAVILGTPMRLFNIHGLLSSFLKKNVSTLADKKLFLYISAIMPDSEEKALLKMPAELKEKFIYTQIAGAIFEKKKTSLFEKIILKVIEKAILKGKIIDMNTVTPRRIDRFLSKVKEGIAE